MKKMGLILIILASLTGIAYAVGSDNSSSTYATHLISASQPNTNVVSDTQVTSEQDDIKAHKNKKTRRVLDCIKINCDGPMEETEKKGNPNEDKK